VASYATCINGILHKIVLVTRISVDPGKILGNHQVDYPASNEILGFANRFAVCSHAAGLLTEKANFAWTVLHLVQVILIVSIRRIDILNVLVLGRNATEYDHEQLAAWIAWN
jgi:hypothetical protein